MMRERSEQYSSPSANTHSASSAMGKPPSLRNTASCSLLWHSTCTYCNHDTAFGIDISKYQAKPKVPAGSIFETIKNHADRSVFIAARAGVSWGYRDPQFTYHWNQMGTTPAVASPIMCPISAKVLSPRWTPSSKCSKTRAIGLTTASPSISKWPASTRVPVSPPPPSIVSKSVNRAPVATLSSTHAPTGSTPTCRFPICPAWIGGWQPIAGLLPPPSIPRNTPVHHFYPGGRHLPDPPNRRPLQNHRRIWKIYGLQPLQW